MASRKTPRPNLDSKPELVPALRDAVAVVDRALADLGHAPAPRRKRASRTKPRKR
jgi:hypothetical protein